MQPAESSKMVRPLILLIRHGESESNNIFRNEGDYPNVSDAVLTKLGHQQAEVTANHLMQCFKNYGTEMPKITVWMSPFMRTQQTAAPFIELAKDSIVHTEVIPTLQEYTSISKHLSEELIKAGCINHQSWNHFIENVRTFNTQLKKTYRALQDDEILVIFGHSIVISVLLSYYASQRKNMPATIDDISIHIPNCSITSLKLNSKGRWNIYTTASIAHLPSTLVPEDKFMFGTLPDTYY